MSDLLPEQLPPDQEDSASQAPGSMDVKATCTPSLGQATIIARDRHSIRFTVLLEQSSHSSLQGQPQLSIWHNHNGQHEWQDLELKPTASPDPVMLASHLNANRVKQTWFTGELSGLPKHGHAVSFTLKWRVGSHGSWSWIKDGTGVDDGLLLYQSCSSVDSKKHGSYKFSHFFDDISPDIEVSTEEPETSHTLLYSLTCPVSPAKDVVSGYSHHRLGLPKDCVRWFALVRLWSPWLAPRHGKGHNFELDKEGILLSFLRSDGMHVVCLAISGIQDVLTTFIHGNGNVEIKGRNDSKDAGTSQVLVAVAESFETANAAVMYHARRLVAKTHSQSPSAQGISTLTDSHVKPEWLQEWYEGLTYCTWNGLGQNLTAQKILDAVDDLHKNNLKITNLIIDDNWQSLSSGDSQFKRGWSEFEANPSGFPEGLGKLTKDIRTKYPNVQHIAVWHAILGYWGGIDPQGKIAEEYKTIEVEKEPGVAGGTFTVVAAEDAERLYDDFYAFLAKNGIDAVKTDAQFFLDLLLHAPDRRKLITEYQDAWTIAHLRHFSSRAISCMSQFPQAIFHSQLPQNKPTLLLRNSDDFFPGVEASHAWHIFCNAHNSLLTQHLNALPDWDMFQTSHDWAAFHAAARCVSGGPIYFTDKPGEHDLELIGQMCAQTVQDKTVILRPSRVGKTVEPYNPYDAQKLLKIGTYVGMSEVGSGILGVFNVGKSNLTEFVRLDEFPGTEKGEYVVGSFRLQEVSGPMHRGDDKAFVGLEMGTRGWDILTAYPAPSFHLSSSRQPVRAAVMGLLGKMTGAAAVSSAKARVEPNGRLRVSVSLKALGVLGLWLSDLDQRTVLDDFMVTMDGNPISVECVTKSNSIVTTSGKGGVLEIDVTKAWKDSGKEAGWSNEVEVEIFVSR